MPRIRTENLAMAYQLTVLFTSALSPPFVNAGVRFLAPLPGNADSHTKTAAKTTEIASIEAMSVAVFWPGIVEISL